MMSNNRIDLEPIIDTYFYKKTEMSNLLANYSDINHTHDYTTIEDVDVPLQNILNWLNDILDTSGLSLQECLDQLQLTKQNMRNQLENEGLYKKGAKFKEYYLLLDEDYDISSDYADAQDEHMDQIVDIHNVFIVNEILNINALKIALKKLIESIYGYSLDGVPFTKYHNYITSNPVLVLETSANSVVWGGTVTLTATIETQAILTLPKINFYDYNGTLIETVDCVDKVATLEVTTPNTVGSLNYIARFEYNSKTTVEDSVIINTTKHNTSLTRNHTGTLYRTHYLRYTLKDTTNNSVIPSQTVSVTYKTPSISKTVNATTNASGLANVQLTDTTSGTCTDQAVFSENTLYNGSSLASKSSTYEKYIYKKILGSKSQESKTYAPWGVWYGSWSNLDDDTSGYMYCEVASKSGSAVNRKPAIITGTFNLGLATTDTVLTTYAIVRHYRGSLPRHTCTVYGKTVSNPTTTSVRKAIDLGITSVSKLNNLTAKLVYGYNTGDVGYLYLQTFMVGSMYIPAQTFTG